MMTIHQALKQAQRRLKTEDTRFDAMHLAMQAFGLNKTQLRLEAERQVDPTAYFELVQRRAAGEPLQYLLGCWEFYGLAYAVGPGVLIPRPETEMLVDLARKHLKDYEAPTVLDLCAGTGCVGLSVAHHCPKAQVYLLELSEDAMPYLMMNASRYPNAHVVQGDVRNAQLAMNDVQAILSNPPYIPSSEMQHLSIEVRQEPAMALDGGADGMQFYRTIAEVWRSALAPGGMMAMECGEGQAGEIAALFLEDQVEILRDFNEIERVVLIQNKANIIAPRAASHAGGA